MTTKERDRIDILSEMMHTHMGEWKAYKVSDDEYKERVYTLLEKLDKKIDEGHKNQDDQIAEINKELFDDVQGVRQRIYKIESIKNTIWDAIKWAFGGSTFLGIVYYFVRQVLPYLKTIL